MGKKSRKEKKNTNRTEEERLEQVTLIKAKLNEYQLDARFPDIDTLYAIMDSYLDREEIPILYISNLDLEKRVGVRCQDI